VHKYLKARSGELNLYNYSGVSAAALARARQDTARIYGRLGIAMDWRNCPLTAEELAHNTTCELPVAPTRITLRLLFNEMAQRFPMHSDIYGFVLLSLKGGFGGDRHRLCRPRSRHGG
jgi:hypothetical protein